MYKKVNPIPIVINLCDARGFELRKLAADLIAKSKNTKGAERGSDKQQAVGALAEIVIRNELGMPLEVDPDQSLAFDIMLPLQVKTDVKCRGGERPFQEEYLHQDGGSREAKHNLFARQIYDDRLDTDIYVMTHLETPKDAVLPGTARQKKWKLYVCGWVSKKRILNEGVYIPRGSLTEQGNTWFTYRGQEIEYYNKNLNGLARISDLSLLDKSDVAKDEKEIGSPNLTSADTLRIAFDLLGRGHINKSQLEFIKKSIGLETVNPVLSKNQYHHLMQWLKDKGQLTAEEFSSFNEALPEIPFDGI